VRAVVVFVVTAATGAIGGVVVGSVVTVGLLIFLMVSAVEIVMILAML